MLVIGVSCMGAFDELELIGVESSFLNCYCTIVLLE